METALIIFGALVFFFGYLLGEMLRTRRHR